MRLSRLWHNQALGIHPADATSTDAMAAFEGRGRRHAARLSRKIAATGAALLIGLWAIIVVATQFEADAALERARGQGRNLAAAFAAETGRMLDAVTAAMELTADRIRSDLQDGKVDATRLRTELQAHLGAPVQLAVINADGRVLYSDMPPAVTRLDFPTLDEFTRHRDPDAPRLGIGHPILEGTTPIVGLPVTFRISSTDGRFLGVLMLSLTASHVTRLYQSVDLGKRGSMSLICPDGLIRIRYVADHPGDDHGVGTSVREGPFDPNLPPGGVTSYIWTSNVDQVVRLYTLRRLTDYDLFVAVGLDLDDVLAGTRTQKLLSIAVGAMVSLLIGLLTVLLIREIWRRTLREFELAREHGRLEAAHAQILRDRERLAATNRELIRAAERADAASQAKSQFLANMSHELRTPLHAIIGFSELIKEQAARHGPGAPITDYANDILTSGRHLLDLINTVLDLSKVESGTALLTEIVVPLSDVVQASVIAVRAQARAREISITVRLPEDAPLVRIDLTKLRQVLINVLSNAVKFTPAGGSVTIGASMQPDGAVTLTVADTGIGMTEAEIQIAMEPFGQVDSTLSRLTDGTGLGLPLALRLMELHGGSLRLRSVKGKGTTVEITIPPDRVVQDSAVVPGD